ncbi:hypothetical protein L3X38_036819 [Prunus dulcis]|uniref:Uncharacterized protein n=1 Tax=Prunus dulcis TaxID=3755 RepID=A0AAD4V3X7_PRUDU|nr:hypothetical protein L3X38_036819 [Prunus dulcis]
MLKLDITVDELSRSRLMIQELNQGEQRAMGMIKIELMIGDLKSNTLFHVIDAMTSCNLLLGRLWVHENGIVPSTLHECFKFYRGGADAKFYINEDVAFEVIPVEVHSTGQAITRKYEHSKCLSAEKNGDNKSKSTAFRQMGSLLIDLQKMCRKSSVPGFVRPLQDATRRKYLPVKRTKEGFDPNAYKLMSKAGYDFGLSSSLRELNPDVTGERTHGLS